MKPEDQLRSETIQPVATANETVREQDKIMIVLSYLGLLALIPLLTVKDSEFVKWHAKQGLVLGVAIFVLSFVLGFIPVLGCIAAPAALIAWLVFGILGITKGLKGERYRIPGVADLSEKF